MDADQALPAERMPLLLRDLPAPMLCGTAALTSRAFAGAGIEALFAAVDRPIPTPDEAAARLLDASCALQLCFRREQGLRLQAQALTECQVFRIAPGASERPLRVLAFMAPGDLMVNAPLDFITAGQNVRLDLLYVMPGRPLPVAVPDHDVAFFAVSESDPATLARLEPVFAAWQRPVLNDPGRVRRLSRDALSHTLAGLPGVRSPLVSRAARDGVAPWIEAQNGAPALIRPVGSHAGANLAKLDGADDLCRYLGQVPDESFYLVPFEEYCSPDGLYRKYRVACIDGVPFLCHMAASEHWMVHYLNAGMAESAGKRADEAAAMDEFDTGFARRHAAAFVALHRCMGLDYAQIDCAETRDGRLLVFEADVAAIIHAMDPPDLYPYKLPQMRRVFAAFEAMLRRRAAMRPGFAAQATGAAAAA